MERDACPATSGDRAWVQRAPRCWWCAPHDKRTYFFSFLFESISEANLPYGHHPFRRLRCAARSGGCWAARAKREFRRGGAKGGGAVMPIRPIWSWSAMRRGRGGGGEGTEGRRIEQGSLKEGWRGHARELKLAVGHLLLTSQERVCVGYGRGVGCRAGGGGGGHRSATGRRRSVRAGCLHPGSRRITNVDGGARCACAARRAVAVPEQAAIHAAAEGVVDGIVIGGGVRWWWWASRAGSVRWVTSRGTTLGAGHPPSWLVA
jgi:hypothetical protein